MVAASADSRDCAHEQKPQHAAIHIIDPGNTHSVNTIYLPGCGERGNGQATQIPENTPVNVAGLILHLGKHIWLHSLIVWHTEEGVQAHASGSEVHDNVEGEARLLVPLHMRSSKAALHNHDQQIMSVQVAPQGLIMLCRWCHGRAEMAVTDEASGMFS